MTEVPTEMVGGDDNKGISKFYENRTVLITGATGFLGKVLVEKLLRACPGIKRMYLLMRAKRNVDIRLRVEQMATSPLFQVLKTEQPYFMNKMIPISGDITLPGLGLNATDEKLIIDEVSIVFHSAATVRFDESLRDAVTQNLEGTKKITDLCHKMKHLEALVHVSTAYCNCYREEIEEKVYPMSVQPLQILDALEWMDDATLESITPKLLGQHPNTYTFTKALAETFLAQKCSDLPIAIVRPSIVVAAWQEPVPGWVDSLNGATGIIAATGKGFLRTLYFREEMIADIIPVDVAINLMIAAGWSVATVKQNKPVVFNCTSGSINPITWKDIKCMGIQILPHSPFNNIIWYPALTLTSNKLYNVIHSMAVHVFPAYLADAVCLLKGRKRMFVKMLHRIQNAIAKLEYFGHRQWKFGNENLWALWNALSKDEKEMFNFDIRQLNWLDYIINYVRGVKIFIFKEDESTIPAARKHLQKLSVIRNVSYLLSMLLTCRLMLYNLQPVQQVWEYFMSIGDNFTDKLFNLF